MSLIEVFHYGDCGSFDENNPLKLMEEEYVKEILYYIGSSKANTLTINNLSEMISLEIGSLTNIIKKMKKLNLITEKDGLFTIAFTMILEKDLNEIDEFSKTIAYKVSDAIEKSKDEIYKIASGFRSAENHDIDELLYHIIASHILDGLAIEALSESGLFKTSKLQKDNRDYILFAFEKSVKVNEFSDNLLCSCNSYRAKELSFVSFGDAAGNRNDIYRFNRQVLSQINRINAREETKANYTSILEKNNHEMILRCSNIVKEIVDNDNVYKTLDTEDRLYADYLVSLGYLEEHSGTYKVNVPIFYPQDKDFITAIHDILMAIISPILSEKFEQVEGSLNISAIEHGVDVEEVLNEMWHQVFGNINESLVKNGMIKQPDFFEGEGRYLKAIFMKSY